VVLRGTSMAPELSSGGCGNTGSCVASRTDGMITTAGEYPAASAASANASSQGLTLVNVRAQLEHICTHSWVNMGNVGHNDSSS